MTAIEKRSEQACFGGRQGFYTHASTLTGTKMNFSVYLPPKALGGTPVPALYYLAGLTCTEETFMIKAGAQRLAADAGLALVTCDTSPRGLNIPGDSDAWDFGVGAGFYVDATQAPWKGAYCMGSYVNIELPQLIEDNFPVIAGQRGIFGHSMGGHGALVTALRHPDRWKSVSAFAPISNPVAVPWGQKAFGNYLGSEQSYWQDYDASMLMSNRAFHSHILVDQGSDDAFLQRELHPEALQKAAEKSGQSLILRMQPGYDHSYWFIQTFMADHITHHAKALKG